MKQVASVFTSAELDFMREHAQVILDDETDYSDDQLLDIHGELLGKLPCDFDENDEPHETARLFESIISKFYDSFDI